MGLLRALIDAIQGEDDRIGGQRVTKITSTLGEAETATINVESTHDFGEYTEGGGDARLLVNGEVISATGRTATTFTGLTRGVLASTVPAFHPVNTLVFDLSRNRSALDLIYRGLLVNFAIGADLDVIGRNLGLKKCPSVTDEQWRRIIKATAYLAKQTPDSLRIALEAITGGTSPTAFTIREDLVNDPWIVYVQIAIAFATSLRGRFVLNSGEAQLTTGISTVDVNYNPISPPLSAYPGYTGQAIDGRTNEDSVTPYFTFPASGAGTAIIGVYDSTPLTRRGERAGLTNYFLPGGSVAGNTITLGTSPGAAGTPVIVDYTSHSAHYLANNETIVDGDDLYAYLADPLLTARCLLDQVRPAGVKVEVSTLL